MINCNTESSKQNVRGSTIKQLSEQSYNKISSEQVIVNPALLVKELVENSLDAGSKSVSITLEGSKSLDKIRIRDDGSGIPRENLPLLCKRFATTKFEDGWDFGTIDTLGYRGEALNFISLNAKISIFSRTQDAKVGYKAEFRDGAVVLPRGSQLAVAIDPTQGVGTKIEVSEIFFNNLIRRAELNFIRDSEAVARLVWKFALFYRKLSFSVSQNSSLLFKNEPMTEEKGYLVSLVNQQEMTKVSPQDFILEKRSIETEHLTIELLMTDAHIEMNRKTTIIFINGRLCKVEELKRMVATAYRNVRFSVNQSSKHFFCFLAISVDTKAKGGFLDVNSCPKKQNLVLRESVEVVEMLRVLLEKCLRNSRSAVAFKAQSRPSREALLFEHPQDRAHPADGVSGPVIERSDPQRIRLSNAFSKGKLSCIESAETLKDVVPVEWQRAFVTPLIDKAGPLFDFCKKVEFIGLAGAQHLVVQYESLLLLFDCSQLARDVFVYKMVVFPELGVTSTSRKDADELLASALKVGADHGLVGVPADGDLQAARSRVLVLMTAAQGLLARFGTKLIPAGDQDAAGTSIEICRLQILDRFGFYDDYWVLALIKISHECGEQPLTFATWKQALEIIWGYWVLKMHRQFNLSSTFDLAPFKDYFEELLLDLKQELVCSSVDISCQIQPIADLELTYKTFERC